MDIVEKICDSRPDKLGILKLEKVIGAALPDGYRTFLQNHNGGRPKPAKFSFVTRKGMHEDASIHYFFGLHSGQVGSLEKKRASYEGRISDGFLPIAIDPFGNLILIGLSNENYGKIYFWDHELETETPTLENVSFVADSFQKFLENLVEHS